jgi:hypothetical protein
VDLKKKRKKAHGRIPLGATGLSLWVDGRVRFIISILKKKKIKK